MGSARTAVALVGGRRVHCPLPVPCWHSDVSALLQGLTTLLALSDSKTRILCRLLHVAPGG